MLDVLIDMRELLEFDERYCVFHAGLTVSFGDDEFLDTANFRSLLIGGHVREAQPASTLCDIFLKREWPPAAAHPTVKPRWIADNERMPWYISRHDGASAYHCKCANGDAAKND
jgi:hypothetical protein